MPSTKELLDLIRSLKANEKRYFKIFSRLHGEEKSQPNYLPRYVKLFDLIDQYPSDDSDALEEVIKSARLVREKHLPQERVYLEERIFRAMREFHSSGSGKSSEVQIHELLETQRFLYKKGLPEQSIRILKRAKRIAYQYDHFHLLKEILFRLRKLIIERNRKELKKALLKLKEEENQANELSQEYEKYLHASQIMFAEYRTESIRRNGELSAEVQEVIDSGMLEDAIQPQSFITKHLYWFSKALLAMRKKELASAQALFEVIIVHWEARKDRIRDKPNGYKVAIANYLMVLQAQQSFGPVFLETIAKLKRIKSRNLEEEAESFQNYAYFELIYHFNRRDFAAAKNLEKDLVEGFENYDAKINHARKLAFFHTLSSLNFVLGDFSAANNWIREIQNYSHLGTRQDIIYATELLSIIVHYELGNHELLENYTRNTRRLLKKKGRLHEFENLLLQKLRRLPDLVSKSEKISVFEFILDQLRSSLKLTGNLSMVGASEMEVWLISKIESRPIQDVAQTFLG